MTAADPSRYVVLLAGRYGLELDPAALRFEEAGLDFRVVFARTTDGTEWVLRIPRRPELAETIRVEARTLRFARRVLTVAVPDWRVSAGDLAVAGELRDRWRARLDDDGLWPEEPAFTHGELYPAHLLLDPQDRILSVLDWTTAKVGDPAVDFAYQHMIAPPEVFDLTVRAYVEAGHDEPRRLRERCAEIIAAAPVAYAVFALETGAPEHREAAQAQLLAT